MISKKEREIIVQLHLKGKTQHEIAELIGCSQPTVHKWINRSKKGQTLETLPRSGRPTKLTKEALGQLKKKILSKIESANAQYSSVSTKQMQSLVKKEIGKTYSMRHIERTMHKLGFSLITPRSEHLRHDQKKVDQFRDEFKKNSNRNIWVMN